jgi:hypothetical protein
MNLLFLDFDGVLNSDAYDPIYLELLRQRPGTDLDRLSPPNCEVLQEILAQTPSQIVISSSWRTQHTQEQLEEILIAKGVTNAQGRVIGMTPTICTSWKDDYRQRSLEIQWWLANHANTEDTRFAILEDQEDMCELREHMVWIDPRYGLTNAHVHKVLNALNVPVNLPCFPPQGGTVMDNGEYLKYYQENR